MEGWRRLKTTPIMLKHEMGGIGVLEGWGGLKTPSVMSKHEMEGTEVPRAVF